MTKPNHEVHWWVSSFPLFFFFLTVGQNQQEEFWLTHTTHLPLTNAKMYLVDRRRYLIALIVRAPSPASLLGGGGARKESVHSFVVYHKHKSERKKKIAKKYVNPLSAISELFHPNLLKKPIIEWLPKPESFLSVFQNNNNKEKKYDQTKLLRTLKNNLYWNKF